MNADDLNRFADQILAELSALADPVRAEGEKRYFKGTINNLGITAPKMQALEKHLCAGLQKTWSVADAMALGDILLQKGIFEATQFGLMFLQRFADKLGPEEFARCERWLADDLCDNWASVDTLCPHVISTIVRNHPEVVDIVQTWARSENRWVRRASAVTFVLLVRKGEFLDAAYEIAEVLFADKNDDLVQKGNGWMLRDAGTTDRDRLERFLIAHGPDIPRTTLRYAIEKFPKEQRQALLVATKPR